VLRRLQAGIFEEKELEEAKSQPVNRKRLSNATVDIQQLNFAQPEPYGFWASSRAVCRMHRGLVS
jgi:hypothetical protein